MSLPAKPGAEVSRFFLHVFLFKKYLLFIIDPSFCVQFFISPIRLQHSLKLYHKPKDKKGWPKFCEILDALAYSCQVISVAIMLFLMSIFTEFAKVWKKKCLA